MLIVVLVIFLRIISNPFSNVVQKHLAKTSNPLFINFFTYFLLSILCIPLAIYLDWTDFTASFWTYAIMGGLFGGVGNAFLIKAIEKGELSVLGPINSYKSLVGIVFGFLLLKEIPSLIGVVGIIFIIAGSYFIFDTIEERFSVRLLLRKDIVFRIIALICTAIEAVFIKKVILLSSVMASFIVWSVFGALFSMILMLVLWKKSYVISFKISDIKLYSLLVLSVAIMQASTNYVFNKINVGYALALFQLSSLLCVFLGYKFFNEKNLLKKLIGASIMILGSVIIILN